MSIPFTHFVQFFLALLFGIAMLVEGILIGILHKQTTPLPSKILYWISVGLVGKEKSMQRFSGKNTPENLRTYTCFVFFFGILVTASSFVYLNGIIA